MGKSKKKPKVKTFEEKLFEKIILKRVIKENHTGIISDIVNNPFTPFDNLVATISDNRLTVYDNQHCGNNMDLCFQFYNEKQPFHEENTSLNLTSACWLLQTSLDYNEEDSFLAMGSEDHLIHILSIAHKRVKYLLRGHEGEILQVLSLDKVDNSSKETRNESEENETNDDDVVGKKRARKNNNKNNINKKPKKKYYETSPTEFKNGNGLLLSLSSDGSVRIWCYPTETCLAVYNFSPRNIPTSITVETSEATSFTVGNAKGNLIEFNIPEAVLNYNIDENEEEWSIITIDENEGTSYQSKHHNKTIDCIKYTSKNKLISKSTDGKVGIWLRNENDQFELLQDFQIHGPFESVKKKISTKYSRTIYCRFDVSPCGNYFSVGNSDGEIVIYNLNTLKNVFKIYHSKQSKNQVSKALFSTNTIFPLEEESTSNNNNDDNDNDDDDDDDNNTKNRLNIDTKNILINITTIGVSPSILRFDFVDF